VIGEEEMLALVVIKTTEEALRDAHDRLVCDYTDLLGEATCSACGKREREHQAPWVQRYLADSVDTGEWAAVRGAVRVYEALEQHAEMKRFFTAGPSASSFPMYCALLQQYPRKKLEELRPVLFFPWSPVLLRRAIKPAMAVYWRKRKGKVDAAA